jgi:hypothetical protein
LLRRHADQSNHELLLARPGFELQTIENKSFPR